MAKLKVAMIATPWIKIPPQGYGGTEVVVHGLVRQLVKMGVEVELFTTGQSRIRGAKIYHHYTSEQYRYIHRALYESSPIVIGHMLFALNHIQKSRDFDIIHDHNPYIGPLALEWFTQMADMPPAVHTHHGPPYSDLEIESTIPDNLPMWKQLGGSKRLHYIGISNALMKGAPREIKKQTLPAVHNAIDVRQFPYQPKKENYYITLGRFTRDKGQHTAARLADKLGYRLRMAGNVAGIDSPRKLLLALANPLSKDHQYSDFKYYHDFVWPYTLKNTNIGYVGNLGGDKKLKFIANAKALLFPIDWEEPFGLAPIEAMACGTPVVAMNRGAMPEIIKHGVTGFLANNISEFEEYMQRVDEIDPAACRKLVREKFSVETMGKNYLDRYMQVLQKDKALK